MAEYILMRTVYDSIAANFNDVAKKLKANKDVIIKASQDNPFISTFTIETTPEALEKMQFDLIGWKIAPK